MSTLLQIILGVSIGLVILYLKQKKPNLFKIKTIDDEINEINQRSSERLKNTATEKQLEILSKYGVTNTYTKDEINEKKKKRIEKLKSESLKKIEEYFQKSYISLEQKSDYINNWVENKKVHTFPEYNNVTSKNISDTDEDIWEYIFEDLDYLLENDKRISDLSKLYGKDDAIKIVNEQVWLNMTKEQLLESRDEPSDSEQELTSNGEIETLIYGNKQTGSYFVLQDNRVIKIKDRKKDDI